jgi:hypothetical protein
MSASSHSVQLADDAQVPAPDADDEVELSP